MDSFFGIGLFELILIAVIALVVLGPERLPGAMREAAKYMRQLRQVSSEFQSQFSDELQMLDELNPKRILNDTINPPAPKQPLKQPTSKSTTQAGRAAPSGAGDGAAQANSILPPKPAPTAAPATEMHNGAAALETTDATAPPVQADLPQPAPEGDNPAPAAGPAPAENRQ